MTDPQEFSGAPVDLRDYGSCTLEDDGCATCGDVAIPVRVRRLLPGGVARCEDRTGRQAEIMTDFTPDVEPGDILLIHMGVAIARVHASAEVEASS